MNDLRLDDVFIYLIERTEKQTKRYANEVLRNSGIEVTPEQWTILKRISEQKVINQREMADLTFKDPASVTRALDVLQQMDLIRRAPMENDRRAYNLLLTEAGEALVAKVTPLAQAIRAKGLENVSDSELAQLKSTLNKIYQNYS